MLPVLLALFAGVTMGGACVTCVTLARPGSGEIIPAGRERVGVIELNGPITDTKEVVQHLREFARRGDLAGIVVRIDSPGGAVAPSQEIYAAMRHAAKSKPIVASMGSVAASGGFWASLGADWVFASPGSITGSIGVITQTPDLRGVAESLRFGVRTFKSGPLKDAGNPFRELTPEDEALFTGLIADIYEQFITTTAERRGLDLETVKRYADGRVMTGRAAHQAKLVDELGGLYEAARRAAHLGALKAKGTATPTTAVDLSDREDPTLVYPRRSRPSFLDLLSEAGAKSLAGAIRGAADELSSGGAPVELR